MLRIWTNMRFCRLDTTSSNSPSDLSVMTNAIIGGWDNDNICLYEFLTN